MMKFDENQKLRALSTMDSVGHEMREFLQELQEIIQRDEGNRGISALVEKDALFKATGALKSALTGQNAAHVIILTGFPCLVDRDPPTETDGPPGAAALAVTLAGLGHKVTIVIEDHSQGVMKKCVEAAASHAVESLPVTVASFPTSDRWTLHDSDALNDLKNSASALVCIERAGPARDGNCYTMRGLCMGKSLLGNINQIFENRDQIGIAIGDGGNELGMGSLVDKVCQNIPLGDKIACVVPADAVLVSSVSNWGAYALSFAIFVACSTDFSAKKLEDFTQKKCLGTVPDEATVKNTILACNEAGAVDGVTRSAEGHVDGMPLSKHIEIVKELRVASIEEMKKFHASDSDTK